MFVGWDWASTTHDVTVIDDAGNIVDRWAPEHTELGLEATLARLTRHGPPEQLPGRSSGQAAWSWTGCWPPATPSSHPPQRLPRRPAPLGCGRSQVRSR